MPKIFEKCPSEVSDLGHAVICSDHPNLIDAGVAIEYVFTNDLSHHGYAAAGVVKVMTLENRSLGSADVRLKLDKGWWGDHNDSERRAILSHEFTHIVPVFEKKRDDGHDVYKTDDLGRPVLRVRKHDFQCGIFYSTIEKYQESAPDLQVIAEVNKQLRDRNLIQKAFWG